MINKKMTSRTNYYKTVTQIFSFDEHKDDNLAEVQLQKPKKESFYVRILHVKYYNR